MMLMMWVAAVVAAAAAGLPSNCEAFSMGFAVVLHPLLGARHVVSQTLGRSALPAQLAGLLALALHRCAAWVATLGCPLASEM